MKGFGQGGPFRRRIAAGSALLLLPLLAAPLPHAEASSGEGVVVVLTIEGPIGPAADDYLGRSLAKAKAKGAKLAVVRMDTPGGLDTSMREIIRKILGSEIPVAVFVAPEGARAASAGTYILYAAHIAAMAPATSVGAATPVQIGGVPGQPDDAGGEGEEAGAMGAMERKMVNDAVSYIRGLAELRGRNAEWAEEAVRRGASLTSSEALERNVIDHRVESLEELLEQVHGRTVRVLDADRVVETRGLEIEVMDPDWRTRLLTILTNPNVALILMLVGVYGLIFEFSNPGALVPGIIGGICLLVALFALHLLPINYAGLALIAFGVALMAAEAFVPSFGALGVGGIAAFVLGAVILVEFEVPGFELHLPVVIGVAVSSAIIVVGIMAMAMKAWKRPVVSGEEAMVGACVGATEDFEQEGRIRIQGEWWKARSSAPVRKGQQVVVTGVEGLLLHVEPVAGDVTQKEEETT